MNRILVAAVAVALCLAPHAGQAQEASWTGINMGLLSVGEWTSKGRVAKGETTITLRDPQTLAPIARAVLDGQTRPLLPLATFGIHLTTAPMPAMVRGSIGPLNGVGKKRQDVGKWSSELEELVVTGDELWGYCQQTGQLPDQLGLVLGAEYPGLDKKAPRGTFLFIVGKGKTQYLTRVEDVSLPVEFDYARDWDARSKFYRPFTSEELVDRLLWLRATGISSFGLLGPLAGSLETLGRTLNQDELPNSGQYWVKYLGAGSGQVAPPDTVALRFLTRGQAVPPPSGSLNRLYELDWNSPLVPVRYQAAVQRGVLRAWVQQWRGGPKSAYFVVMPSTLAKIQAAASVFPELINIDLLESTKYGEPIGRLPRSFAADNRRDCREMALTGSDAWDGLAGITARLANNGGRPIDAPPLPPMPEVGPVAPRDPRDSAGPAEVPGEELR